MAMDNSEQHDSYPYDWEAHGKMAQELDHLDKVDLMLGRRQMSNDILKDFILKGPYGESPNLAVVREIDGGRLAAYVPQRLNMLSNVIAKQLNLVQDRADYIAKSTDVLISALPEEKYHPALFRMTQSAIAQLSDLQERIISFNTIIASASVNDLGESKLRSHRKDIESLCTIFRDTVGYADPTPVSERLPKLKDIYHRMSLFSFEQAAVEKEIAEEYISVIATDMLLRDVFGAKSNIDVGAFKSAASSLLLSSMIDLEYAAALRHGIYMMDQSGRPSFVTGAFLSDSAQSLQP